MIVYINGNLVAQEDAKISVFDHGFLYGEGVFETLQTKNKKIFKIDNHINRIFNSSQIIGLLPPLKKEELKDAIEKTVAANDFKESRIRVTITAGNGPIGYDKDCEPNVVIMVQELIKPPEENYTNGVKVISVNAERQLPEAKTTNCLVLSLSKKKASAQNTHEALLINPQGNVTEGTTTNLFLVKNNTVITPNKGILEGVTRSLVLDLVRKQNMNLELRDIKKEELYSADEIFITSTTQQLVPVVEVDGKVIGDGVPGRIQKELSSLFSSLV
jgi:branched-chain amino acid aminotransferase